MIRCVAMISLCLGVVACGSKKKAPTDSPVATETKEVFRPQVSNAGDRDLVFDAAGYGGVISFALWPEHWSKLPAVAAAITAKLPEGMRAPATHLQQGLLAGDTPWKVLHLGATNVGLGAIPETIPGLDPTRPIVASLGRPLGVFEAMANKVLSEPEQASSALHSRVVLPASDSHLAMDAIASGLLAGGFTEEEAGAHEKVLRSDEHIVRLQAARVWIGIDVVTGNNLADLPIELLEDPTPKHLSDALFTDGPDAVARLQLRYRKMEDTGAHLGMTMVARALHSVADNLRVPLFVEGYSEVLSIPMLMDPRGRSATDVILELSATDAPQLHGIFSLTKGGAVALATGMKAESPTPLRSVDWKSILANAPYAPAMEKASVDEIAELYHEAGFASYMYSAGVNALALGRSWATENAGSASKVIDDVLANGPDLSGVRLILGTQHLVAELLGEESRFRGVYYPSSSIEPLSDAETCYRNFQAELRWRLHSYNSLDRTAGKTMMAKTMPKLEPMLLCAEKSPDYGERVQAVRETFKTVLAELPSN